MGALKVGVIGLGDISTVYLNNLKNYPEVVELYGCACTSLEKARRKAGEFGFQKAYTTHPVSGGGDSRGGGGYRRPRQFPSLQGGADCGGSGAGSPGGGENSPEKTVRQVLKNK